MNELIYLESDEEITSVIEKLKKAEAKSIALVIPRGGTLAQSIVNLKLLKKSASGIGKAISIVTADRISRNLASQIGLTVFSKSAEATEAVVEEAATPIEENGFKINSYYQKKGDEAEEEEVPADEVEPEESEESPTIEPGEVNAVREQAKEEEAPDEDLKRELASIDHSQEEEEEEQPEAVEEVAQAQKTKKIIVQSLEEDSDNGGEMKSGKDRRRVGGSRKPLLIIAGVALVLLLASSYIFLPYATATVQIKTEDLLIEKEVAADTTVQAIDEAKLTVPASIVSVEKEVSKTFTATGKRDDGTKAVGTLTFSNKSGNANQITAGTIVKSAGGVEFTVDQTFIVPKADVSAGGDIVDGKITGKVTASVAGEKGNLPAGTTYSVTGRTLITAAGEATGGVSKFVMLVSDQDLKAASTELTKDLVESNKVELLDQAKEQNKSLFEAQIKSEILSQDSTKKVNEEATTFDYKVKFKVSATAFNPNDVTTLLLALAKKDLSEDKMVVGEGNINAESSLSAQTPVNGVLELDSTMTVKTGKKFSVDSIRTAIKNKKYQTAKDEISKMEAVEKVDLKIWPSTLFRIPMIKSRINVKFGYAS